MHHQTGRLTVTTAAADVTLWLAAAATTALAAVEPPADPVRSSLILADLWLLVGAMTATLSWVILYATARNRNLFYHHGYLSGLRDAETAPQGRARMRVVGENSGNTRELRRN